MIVNPLSHSLINEFHVVISAGAVDMWVQCESSESGKFYFEV